MAISIKALNNNCSFLITLAPPVTPEVAKNPELFPGAFTILIDPWLQGKANFGLRKVLSPPEDSFVPRKDIPWPDMVIISQDRPDHFHKQTLLQMDDQADHIILGPKSVISSLRGWGHFDNSILKVIRPYHSAKPETIFKMELPAVSHLIAGSPGEVTISYMKPRFSSSQSAIGITYRPPSSVLTDSTTRTIDLPASPTTPSVPRTPHINGRIQPSSPTTRSESHFSTVPEQPRNSPTLPPSERVKMSNGQSIAAQVPLAGVHPVKKCNSRTAEVPSEKTISLLWCPHGAAYKIIAPWASSVLIEKAALPLSVLFHGLSSVRTPWYSGGGRMDEVAGGIEIAKNLMPKVWIGCQDEELALQKRKSHGRKEVNERRVVADIQANLMEESSEYSGGKKEVKLCVLQSGENFKLGFRQVKRAPIITGNAVDTPPPLRYAFTKAHAAIAE